MIYLDANETIEDLQISGLRLIQKKDGFRFGEDSVLLANYVVNYYSDKSSDGKQIYDFGCNSGCVSMLIAGKLPNVRVTGIEILRSAAETFYKNIEINNMHDRINCINIDWKDISKAAAKSSADTVVSNPPYAYNMNEDNISPGAREISRSEFYSGVDDLVHATEYVLKPSGLAFYIYRADRLTDVLSSLRKYRMEPIRIRFIQPFIERPPKAFIVTARKHGRVGRILVEKPLIIFKSLRVYTDEVLCMYGKTPAMSKEELYRGISLIE